MPKCVIICDNAIKPCTLKKVLCVLFLRTPVALGVKKPHEFEKNSKCVSFQWYIWGFDQVEFKKSDCDNDNSNMAA